jgi:maltooligosyltrehalose trehalohydrolase
MPDGRPREAQDDAGYGTLHHRQAWGAEPEGDGRWRFALWAPEAREVEIELGRARHALGREPDGFWSARIPAQAGDAYRFVVDGGPTPDLAARAAAGPDAAGPSRLVDPRSYRWTTSWAGRPWEEAVIYEIHVGTFTPEGTFAAAARRMPDLAALGITAVELMPVAHFPGARGWGYDGILLGAPHPAYGSPDDLRAFVEAAQGAGVMVILDVVLNHFSPEGSDVERVAPGVFDPERSTPWGPSIAFEKPAVRSFFIDLCLRWITEYRLDGLRFDAVHEIHDPSSSHVLVELAERIRATDWGRPVHLVTEDSRNIPDLREPGRNGRPLYDAEWNDDFHHAIHCLLTDETHSYLASFAEDPMADIARALAEGYVEQGQSRAGQDEPRGAPAGHLPWTAFVNHNQNHDQVGNHPSGRRLVAIADGRAVQVAHAMLLAGPFIPMLFMGEEEGERGPFFYFCDVSPALAETIGKGRIEEFGSGASGPADFPDPNALETFEASRPFTDSGSDHARHWRDLTRRLLSLRHDKVVPLLKSGRAGPAEAMRTGPFALTATWPFHAGRLVMRANLGEAPGDASAPEGGWDLQLWDLATDPFAFGLAVTRP